MKIVLDTNVLVSGLLSPHGACGGIVRMLTRPDIVLCVDSRIMFEYAEVLKRPKFKFNHTMIGLLLDYLENRSHIYNATPLDKSLPDPDDDKFLEVAVAADAECLITGNLKHYPSNSRYGATVLSPREFLDFAKRKGG